MTPPRLARALLSRAVPHDGSGHSVLADFDEEFAHRAARGGKRRANWWYWQQALSMWWWSAWTHPPSSFHQPRGDIVSGVIGDIRHAVRGCFKNPGQTALIVVTLAVGIGASTIGFSFADTAFIRGLPVADPARTVIIFGIDARQPERRGGVYMSDVLDVRARARTVESISTWTQGRATLIGPIAEPMRVTVSRVTGDLFRVWGITAQLGRTLHAGDSVPGADRAVVLTDRFWRETFSARPDIVGSSAIVDGTPVTVVGVLSPDIEIGTFANIAFWMAEPPIAGNTRDTRLTMVTGRLVDGVSAAQAEAELRVIAETLATEHPETHRGRQLLAVSARRAIGGPNFLLVLSLLLGAAALVVIIASVNVAGVLLARAVVRQREFAMRVALGARHTRLFQQVAIEGLLLATFGGLGGVLVAEAGLGVIRSVDAEPIFQQIVLDWHELLFVAALALLAPLCFSLAPAFAAMRSNVAGVLSTTSARTGGTHSGRARDVLVVAQLGLAVALAVVGGLVARTAAQMTWAPAGFETANLVTATFAFQEHSPDRVTRQQALRALVTKLSESGLRAGALDTLPAVTIESPTVVSPDGISADDRTRAQTAFVVRVNESAFTTLGIPMLEGRMLTDADLESDRAVTVISRSAANRWFGSPQSALGRGLGVELSGAGTATYRVVGVAGDVRDTDPEAGPPLRVWLPLSDPRVVTIAVRSHGDHADAASSLRLAARDLLPGIPVEALESYDRGIARAMGGNRVAMGMLLGFVVVGLIFAATGLYGTVALATNLRRAEFATRLALGANAADIVRLVARHTARLVAFGLVPGLVAGLVLASLIRGLLYGVTPLDPINVAGVIGAISVLAFAASVGPAIRAAQVNVMEAIRGE
jgi:putative ABC transport system permease protein